MDALAPGRALEVRSLHSIQVVDNAAAARATVRTSPIAKALNISFTEAVQRDSKLGRTSPLKGKAHVGND